MKFTKKEIMDAFLLFLDDALPVFDCKKIETEGNSNCDRCDICMMTQYLYRVKSGELPKKTACKANKQGRYKDSGNKEDTG